MAKKHNAIRAVMFVNDETEATARNILYTFRDMLKDTFDINTEIVERE